MGWHAVTVVSMGLPTTLRRGSVYHSGAAGVYDIAMHYQYEDGRGVAELSTMKRAMGGFQRFASQSPAIILNAASGRDPQKHPKQRPNHSQTESQQSSGGVSGIDPSVADAEKRSVCCLRLCIMV